MLGETGSRHSCPPNRERRRGFPTICIVRSSVVVSGRSRNTPALRFSRTGTTKGQVDAGPAGTGFLVDPVLPVALRLALHQEKAARREFQANRLRSLLALVLQYKGPLFAQAQIRKDLSFAKLSLVVAV